MKNTGVLEVSQRQLEVPNFGMLLQPIYRITNFELCPKPKKKKKKK